MNQQKSQKRRKSNPDNLVNWSADLFAPNPWELGLVFTLQIDKTWIYKTDKDGIRIYPFIALSRIEVPLKDKDQEHVVPGLAFSMVFLAATISVVRPE